MDTASRVTQLFTLGLGFFPGLILAASSTNYRIDFDALDSGGGSAGSANYQVRASSAHPQALGEIISAGYRVYGGLISLPDADGDAVADPVDNCPGTANNAQIDTDSDGLGDACDPGPSLVDVDGDLLVDGLDGVVSVGVYSGIDSNGDGYVDGEQDYGTSATNPDTDNDGFGDGDEVYFNSDPLSNTDTPATGDVNEDGVVNVVDLLLVTRQVLGTPVLDADQRVRADVAPVNAQGVPTPDGSITAGDLVRIQQMAVQP